MSGITVIESAFIGLCLEGFFLGIYTVIFVIYLQCHWRESKKSVKKRTTIIFYALCVLYGLSVAVAALDVAVFMAVVLEVNVVLYFRIFTTSAVLFCCCDFISECILIFRCWIVWNCNIRVVIIPSLIAFAFPVIWLVPISAYHITPDQQLLFADWGDELGIASLAMSLCVNAIATGLIVFRIVMVYQGVKHTTYDRALGATEGNKFWPIVFVLIESGMAMFSIQLTRLVCLIVTTDTAAKTYHPIVCVHQMLNGIIPTLILVRVSMGLSFHEEKSMEEVVSRLSFGSPSESSSENEKY